MLLNRFVPSLCLTLSLGFVSPSVVRCFHRGKICACSGWHWLPLVGGGVTGRLCWSGPAVHRFFCAASTSSSTSPAVKYMVCFWWLWAGRCCWSLPSIAVCGCWRVGGDLTFGFVSAMQGCVSCSAVKRLIYFN